MSPMSSMSTITTTAQAHSARGRMRSSRASHCRTQGGIRPPGVPGAVGIRQRILAARCQRVFIHCAFASATAASAWRTVGTVAVAWHRLHLARRPPMASGTV